MRAVPASTQRPRAARCASQQGRRSRIVDNLLGLGIPRDLASGQHRDLAELSDTGRTVRDLGRRQCRVTVFTQAMKSR